MKPRKTFSAERLLIPLKFILPFLIWLFVFRDFVGGRIPVNMDTNTIYSVTKFYFNNLINGVVPMWDPFVLLGTPFYAITICNLFNPFILVVPLLKILGVNYYSAFIIYITFYYFLGAAGFYCLARTLFNDRRAAYIGFLLLLFSGLGASLFNQLTICELFVPAVWFFLFLVRFFRQFRVSDFLGLCYSAMGVVISYLPFYFATLCLIAAVWGGVVYFKDLKSVSSGLVGFVRRHTVVVILGALGVAAACAPLLVYKAIDSSSDVVSPGRHCSFSTIEECYERTMHEEGGMSYKETSQSGGLAERVDVFGLFAHLDKVSFGADQFFFLPLAVVLLLVLTAFLKLDRLSVFLAGVGTVLTLVAMADVTPVHKFLYDHIFFFKYFRNLFFFQAYIIPVIILFTVGQLKRLTEVNLGNITNKKALVLWVLVTHAGMVLFLRSLDGIVWTSYATVAASGLVFLVVFSEIVKKNSKVFWTALALVVLIQPVEVYRHYAQNAVSFQFDLPKAHAKPQFSWTRPTQEIQNPGKIFKFVHYETFYDSMAMKDARGVIGYPPASVTRGAFMVSQWAGDDTLMGFTRNKLFLVDHVRSFDEKPLEIRSAGEAMAARRNVAYVHSDQYPKATFTAEDWGEGPAQSFDGPNDQLKVLGFDVNGLKLTAQLPSKKFLIYTDSFTRHWKAFVNGEPQAILRTNGAFKGIWLPEGKSTIEFRYLPPGGGQVYLWVTAILCLTAGAALWSFRREDNWPWMREKA